MNKKFLSAVLFGALMVSSTGTFVSDWLCAIFLN